MAHDILTQSVDAMLHVQFLGAWRELLYLFIVALLLTHSRSRDVGVQRRRNMQADRIYAMQGVEDFRSSNVVSGFQSGALERWNSLEDVPA